MTIQGAWGHVPALRYTGHTSSEYLRLLYELKHREIPAETVVELVTVDDREFLDEWFTVRVQIDGTGPFEVKPEDIVLWLPKFTLHIKPDGTTFAYPKGGDMRTVITPDMVNQQ